MVKSANMNGLLDNDSDSLSSCQHRVKARLHEILQTDKSFSEEDYDRVSFCRIQAETGTETSESSENVADINRDV